MKKQSVMRFQHDSLLDARSASQHELYFCAFHVNSFDWSVNSEDISTLLKDFTGYICGLGILHCEKRLARGLMNKS